MIEKSKEPMLVRSVAPNGHPVSLIRNDWIKLGLMATAHLFAIGSVFVSLYMQLDRRILVSEQRQSQFQDLMVIQKDDLKEIKASTTETNKSLSELKTNVRVIESQLKAK